MDSSSMLPVYKINYDAKGAQRCTTLSFPSQQCARPGGTTLLAILAFLALLLQVHAQSVNVTNQVEFRRALLDEG